MLFYVEHDGKVYRRNSNKIKYKYANAWRTPEDEIQISWHTSLRTASDAQDRARRDWSDSRRNVDYLLEVYSDDHKPNPTWTRTEIDVSAGWEQQDAWREKHLPGASRHEANARMWDLFHAQLGEAIASLPIVQELGLVPRVHPHPTS